MKRKIIKKIKGFNTIDGAGVKLVRVLGNTTTDVFDPILMLDSFDSTNPDDYTNGFPMHPHRGIETISYVYKGKMLHRDTMGNQDTISDGEVQWMTAGSGLLHEEQIPQSDRVLGVQLWLNLPAKDKMVPPKYNSIKNADIKEIEIPNGYIRLLAGSYKEYSGFKSSYLPFDYYDIHLDANCNFTLDVPKGKSVMAFTLLGDGIIADEHIDEKTAVKFDDGDEISIATGGSGIQLLVMISDKLSEPVHWGGPIVMSSQKDLEYTFYELQNGTFIKSDTSY